MQPCGPFLNPWLSGTFPVLRSDLNFLASLYLLTPTVSQRSSSALKLKTLSLDLISLPEAVYNNLETRLQSPHNRSSKSAGRLTGDLPCLPWLNAQSHNIHDHNIRTLRTFYMTRLSLYLTISCNEEACVLLYSPCFWCVFQLLDFYGAVSCFRNFMPNQMGVVFTLYSLSSSQRQREREGEKVREKYWELTAATSWESVGHRWTISHFSTRPNPSEHFLSWALRHPPPTYSLLLWATRRAHGQIGFSSWPLAFDEWALVFYGCVAPAAGVAKWQARERPAPSPYILRPVIHH